MSHLSDPNPRPVHILGPPGVGKTALVSVVASIVKESYPDGVIHIGLGRSGADDAMRSALDRLGAGRLPEREDELEKRYVSALAGKRIIIILDGATLKSDIERFWPRSEPAAYIILSEKRLRWHEAQQIELPRSMSRARPPCWSRPCRSGKKSSSAWSIPSKAIRGYCSTRAASSRPARWASRSWWSWPETAGSDACFCGHWTRWETARFASTRR
ncbi:hypothetical protein GCM10029992_67130 [Glycomyces albus]